MIKLILNIKSLIYPLKSKADDDSRNANFYSKNVSTLKENKNILTKKEANLQIIYY